MKLGGRDVVASERGGTKIERELPADPALDRVPAYMAVQCLSTRKQSRA